LNDLFVVEKLSTVSVVEDLDARIELAKAVGNTIERNESDGRRRELEGVRLRVGRGNGEGTVGLGGNAGGLGANEDGRARRRVLRRVAVTAGLGSSDLDDGRGDLLGLEVSARFSLDVLALHAGGILLRPLVLKLLTKKAEGSTETGLGSLVVVGFGLRCGRGEEDASGDFGGGTVAEAVGTGGDALEEVAVEEEGDSEGDDDPLRDDGVTNEPRPATEELVDAGERLGGVREVRKARSGGGDGRDGESAVDSAEMKGRDGVDEELRAGLVRGDKLSESSAENRVGRVNLRDVRGRGRVVGVTTECGLGRESRDEVQGVESEEGGDKENLQTSGRAAGLDLVARRGSGRELDDFLAKSEGRRRGLLVIAVGLSVGVAERSRVVEKAREVGGRVVAAEMTDDLDTVDLVGEYVSTAVPLRRRRKGVPRP
jgi:hypothetical protein